MDLTTCTISYPSFLLPFFPLLLTLGLHGPSLPSNRVARTGNQPQESGQCAASGPSSAHFAAVAFWDDAGAASSALPADYGDGGAPADHSAVVCWTFMC